MNKKVKKQTKSLPRLNLFSAASAGKFDMPIFILIMVLLAIGLVMVASSSYVSALYARGDSYFYIKRQAFFAVLGFVAMITMSFVDYHKLRKLAFPLLVVAVIMLIMVLIPGIGVKVNGARRWLNFGIQFQPSEVGKFAIIVSLASYISANYKNMNKLAVGALPLCALAVVVFLVAIETHLSGAILILAVGIIMLFVGGFAVKYFVAMIGVGVSGLAGLILFTPYMQSRISMWFNPFADPQGKGYQIIQSLYAIGSGGLLGLGLGQSRQKHLYIPEPHNDYIFSITAEELGFVGALLIILLFVMFIWRGFSIALHARDKFGSLLAIGIVSRVAVQTILNIAVVTNAMPSTGISLPFFSYGGTSLLVLMFEMGVLLSVSRYAYMDKV